MLVTTVIVINIRVMFCDISNYLSLSINFSESSLSSYDSGYRSYLAVPGSVSASDGSYTNRIEISWGSVTGADSYILQRSTNSGGPYSTIQSNVVSNSYDDATTKTCC